MKFSLLVWLTCVNKVIAVTTCVKFDLTCAFFNDYLFYNITAIFQYETYGTRTSRGIEFEALVHDHWIISRGRKRAQGKGECATGYEQ